MATKNNRGYTVHAEVHVNAVLPFIGKQPNNTKIQLHGILVGVNSNRLKTYIKGCACVKCGVKGTIFRIERQHNAPRWHLNLYAKNSYGHYVMMTSDHIVPKAKGGPNCVHNRQPMCARCNCKKGHSINKQIIYRMWFYRVLGFFGALSVLD